MSVRPSQSLIHYSFKTAAQNLMKLSGIVHYMMPYCTSYFKILFEWFWGFQSKTRTLPYKTWGSGGYHFVSIAYSISSCKLNSFEVFFFHLISGKSSPSKTQAWEIGDRISKCDQEILPRLESQKRISAQIQKDCWSQDIPLLCYCSGMFSWFKPMSVS